MAQKLTFGYLYDFRNPPQFQRNWAELYAEILDVIAWTDQAGFAGAWVPEHHRSGADGYMPAPLVALAAIAARTKQIKIGTGVALAPLYHPVRFAEECAILDILSGGRLEMSLAIGYRRRETDAYGVDFTKRGARFDEFLQIVKALWAGEAVTFEGKHFTIRDAAITPLPPRGKIPLYIGGFADAALQRVAKYADGYFGNEEVCGLYAEKLRNAGKDPAAARIRIQALFLAIAKDPEKAMHELAPYYHNLSNTYGEWAQENKALGMESSMKPMSLEDFKQSGILNIVTPEKAVTLFKDMQSRIPVEHIMLLAPAGLPGAKFVEYAEVFKNEVMPHFA